MKEHFCCLLSWPPQLVDFLINSLYGNQFFHPSYGGPRLWQQGMRELADSLRLWQWGVREVENASGSGSRACMKLRKSQALAAGHA